MHYITADIKYNFWCDLDGHQYREVCFKQFHYVFYFILFYSSSVDMLHSFDEFDLFIKKRNVLIIIYKKWFLFQIRTG